jgi:hypothetical protein
MIDERAKLSFTIERGFFDPPRRIEGYSLKNILNAPAIKFKLSVSFSFTCKCFGFCVCVHYFSFLVAFILSLPLSETTANKQE